MPCVERLPQIFDDKRRQGEWGVNIPGRLRGGIESRFVEEPAASYDNLSQAAIRGTYGYRLALFWRAPARLP